MRAVIFDVDGTLVDSEQEGHRVAFNDAFAALDLPDRWDRNTYRALLDVTGGQARLRAWFDDPRSSVHGLDEERAEALAADLHHRKTDRFLELVAANDVPARPGAAALVHELGAASMTLAIATTGSRAWVAPLLDNLFPERFAVLVTGEEVEARKPDPEAYLLALDRLSLPAGEVVAVEDSGPGASAALAASLPCVVVANDETDLDEVANADLVVTGFGTDQHPMEVLVDRHDAARGDRRLTAETLTRVGEGRS